MDGVYGDVEAAAVGIGTVGANCVVTMGADVL